MKLSPSKTNLNAFIRNQSHTMMDKKDRMFHIKNVLTPKHGEGLNNVNSLLSPVS